MNRRRVLLIVAAAIAALGTLLVFLYVRGADTRASSKYENVQVLKAVAQIDVGETIDAALAAGKVAVGNVPRAQVISGATDNTSGLAGKSALTTIFPGEQIITAKFGDAGAVASSGGLNIPEGKIAISVNLTDTGRVAGFVNPGAKVAIFMNGSDLGKTVGPFTRMLLNDVEVIAVGTTTVVPTTTTDPSGGQTTEQLPRTLFTLALDQNQAEKVLFAQGNGELSFALLTDQSTIRSDRGVTGQNLFG